MAARGVRGMWAVAPGHVDVSSAPEQHAHDGTRPCIGTAIGEAKSDEQRVTMATISSLARRPSQSPADSRVCATQSLREVWESHVEMDAAPSMREFLTTIAPRDCTFKQIQVTPLPPALVQAGVQLLTVLGVASKQLELLLPPWVSGPPPDVSLDVECEFRISTRAEREVHHSAGWESRALVKAARLLVDRGTLSHDHLSTQRFVYPGTDSQIRVREWRARPGSAVSRTECMVKVGVSAPAAVQHSDAMQAWLQAAVHPERPVLVTGKRAGVWDVHCEGQCVVRAAAALEIHLPYPSETAKHKLEPVHAAKHTTRHVVCVPDLPDVEVHLTWQDHGTVTIELDSTLTLCEPSSVATEGRVDYSADSLVMRVLRLVWATHWLHMWCEALVDDM